MPPSTHLPLKRLGSALPARVKLSSSPYLPPRNVGRVGLSPAPVYARIVSEARAADTRKNAGKSLDRPNIVMNTTVHVCWKKAALLFEIEERYCNCNHGAYTLNAEEAISLVDENTILVCAILGSIYTGEYDDVMKLDRLLQAKKEKGASDAYIHVDAASGGFVAPFMSPELRWDFRLPMVVSINVSGHKCK